jgi:hypothetical protein
MLSIAENTVIRDGFFVELHYYGGGCCISGGPRAIVILGRYRPLAGAEWVRIHDFETLPE